MVQTEIRSGKFQVVVRPSGIGGNIHYSDAYTEFSFPFEYTFEPSKCFMIIITPGNRTWTAETGIPLSLMDSTLQKIGERLISHHAPGYALRIYNGFMEIVSGKSYK